MGQTVKGHSQYIHTLFEDLYITGTTDSTMDWISIGHMQFFGIGIILETDSTYWIDASADSIDYSIDYELSLEPPGTEKTTLTKMWKKGASAAQTILTMTVADTINGGWYQSLHDGTADISPGQRIRFIINKGSNNMTISGKIKYSAYMYTQP